MPWVVFFIEKCAAEKRRNAHGAEKSGGGADAVNANRIARAGEIETSGFEYADILETFCVALEILKCAGAPGNFVVAEVDAGRRLAPGEDDAFGVRIRERLEENGVDDAEDGGAGADAEREGEYGDDREARRFREHSQAILQILEQRLHLHVLRNELRQFLDYEFAVSIDRA